MKTLNERIQRLDAAVAALKETAATLPPELQAADILTTYYGAQIEIDARKPDMLKTTLAHFGRDGWEVSGSDFLGVKVHRKLANGVTLIIANIQTLAPAIGSDATPYLP